MLNNSSQMLYAPEGATVTNSKNNQISEMCKI
jgi:hypothetical protein